MQRIKDLNLVKNVLCEMIDHGIETEDGNIRKADIIDYYEICDINIRDLVIHLRDNGVNLTQHERSSIRAFAIKFGGVTLSREDFFKRLQSEKLNIGGIEITDEIKMEVINYFEENNIPFVYMNYQYYIRRLVANMLNQESRGR